MTDLNKHVRNKNFFDYGGTGMFENDYVPSPEEMLIKTEDCTNPDVSNDFDAEEWQKQRQIKHLKDRAQRLRTFRQKHNRKGLTNAEWEVIICDFIDKMDDDTISLMLGMSNDSVRQHKSKARNKISL